MKLPRYVRARTFKNGKTSFYFTVPKDRQPAGWTKTSITLSRDLATMRRQAELLLKDLHDMRRAEQADIDAGKIPGRFVPPGSIPWIVQRYERSARFKDLKPRTQENYIGLSKTLIDWSESAGHPHVKTLSRKAVAAYLATFDDRPSMRNSIARHLRLILNFAMDDLDLIKENPAKRPGTRKVQAKIHVWTDDELQRFVAHCDAVGRASIGTAAMIGYDIGQRPTDILRLQAGRDYIDRRFRFFQSKTGKPVVIKATAALVDRLDGITAGNLVLCETTGRQYEDRRFSKLFRKMAIGAGMDHLVFKHLRHTAIVNLARAKATTAQIAAISGHSIDRTEAILNTYLIRDSDVADSGIAKLEEHRRKKQF